MGSVAIKRVTSTKSVRCAVCGLTIPPGLEHDRWVCQEHGRVISEAAHKVCRRIGEAVGKEWGDCSWSMGDENVVDGVTDWLWQDFRRYVNEPADTRYAATLYKMSRRYIRQYPEWAIPSDEVDAWTPELQVIDGATGNQRTYIPDRSKWGKWRQAHTSEE